jgi:uncharacterized small protein (DUF1192 family)
MSKARGRRAAPAGSEEEEEEVEVSAVDERVLAGLAKLDSVLEVVTRSEVRATDQGETLATTVETVRSLGEQVAKLAEAQAQGAAAAAARAPTPRGRSTSRGRVGGVAPEPSPPEEGAGEVASDTGGEGAAASAGVGGGSPAGGEPLAEGERATLTALEARLNVEELQEQLALLQSERKEWKKKQRKKKKKKKKAFSSSDSSSSDSSGSESDSSRGVDQENPGVPYVPGVLPRPERLYRKGEVLSSCEVIRDSELQLAIGIESWDGLALGARRELAATYGLVARLADLKVGIEAGASQGDVYATVCGIQGFLLPRVQGCLRVADAGGDSSKLALVRALQEALHEQRNALPAMGKEWKKIDKESSKAMWRAASKAAGAAKAAAFGRGAGKTTPADGLSRKQRKSRAHFEKKGWRGAGWVAKHGPPPGSKPGRG